MPAVALAIGRQHADDGLAGRAHPPEREVGDGDGVDVVELAVVDVAGGELGVVERQEADEQRVVGLAEGGHVAEPPSASVTARPPAARRLAPDVGCTSMSRPPVPTLVVGFSSPRGL